MPGLLRRGRRVLSAGLGWLTRRMRRWLARLPELPLLRWAAGFCGREPSSAIAATAVPISAAAFALAAFAITATTKSASSAAIADAASGLCLLLAVQQLLPTRLVLLQPLAMLCEPAVVAGCVLLGDAVTAAVTATASAIAAATTGSTANPPPSIANSSSPTSSPPRLADGRIQNDTGRGRESGHDQELLRVPEHPRHQHPAAGDGASPKSSTGRRSAQPRPTILLRPVLARAE